MERLTSFAELIERGFSEETVVLSSDLRIVFANDTFQKAYNAPADELIGKHCYEILRGCQESCVESKSECPIHEIITTETPVSTTHQDIMVNGECHHFKIDIYPIRPGHNEPVSFLHITRDISSRIEEERFMEKMWAEILGRLEQTYTSMVQSSDTIDTVHKEIDYLTDTIPMAMVGWDNNGSITQWNNSAEILFGWSAHEIIGKPLLNLFSSGQSHDNFKKIFAEMMQGRTLAYGLYENRTQTGHIINCEWQHSTLLEKKGGRVTGGLSLAQDMSKSFSTHKELVNTQAELSTLLKTTEDAIIAVNNFGRLVIWNRASETLFGWRNNEVIGRQVEQFIPSNLMAEYRKTIDDFFKRAQKENIAEQCFEISARHRDGSAIPVRIKLSFAKLKGKSAIIGIIQDISTQRRMEKILAETERSRELGELAAGMAHDFNNLMTVMKGNVQLLKTSISDVDLLTKLDVIEQSVFEGSRKASGIHSLANADSVLHDQLRFELVDINKLILDTIDLTQYRWKDQVQKDGHTIHISTDLADLPLIVANAKIIRDALINIIFNALDAQPADGKIHFVTRMDNNMLIMQVEDNGDGISQENLPRIFNPFFTTKMSSHSGLGLSSVNKNVASHGGTIKAESSQSIGTTITIELPITATQPSAEEPPKNHVATPKDILLVDDDEMITAVIDQCCTNAGHTIHGVLSGRKAIQVLREQKFDLMITDLGMSEMAGEELVQRAKEQWPELPVIMITGWEDNVDSKALQKIGVNEVILKPFDINELIKLIASVTSV